MTHRIEITVVCDQSDLDRLVALVAAWGGETLDRDVIGLNAHARNHLKGGNRAVHGFLIDGKPWAPSGNLEDAKVCSMNCTEFQWEMTCCHLEET